MSSFDALSRELLQLKDPIIQAKTALDALALLRMADEFYSADERRQFYAELEKLKAAAEQAREAICEAGRVAAGRNTDEARIAHKLAMATAQQAQHNVTALEKQHPLLIRLLKAKNLLSL